MAKEQKVLSVILLSSFITASSVFQPNVRANQILFTEVDSSTVKVTLAGQPIDSMFSHGVSGPVTGRSGDGEVISIPESWMFHSFGYTLPDTHVALWETWQRKTTSTYVNLVAFGAAPYDAFYFYLSLNDPAPALPPFASSLNLPTLTPNPVASDGDVVPTGLTTIWLYDSIPITEVGFVDLTDNKSVPDTGATWALLSVAGLALLTADRRRSTAPVRLA
jgi:hypothetical protein